MVQVRDLKIEHSKQPATENHLRVLLIILGLALFCVFFVVVDQAYNRFISARFPDVGISAWSATIYGIVSRAHIILFVLPFILWRPRLIGFQIGKTRLYWRMLLVMLIANCGIVGGYLWLTDGGTPYSANQWLVTEVITVPVVEEVFWRGLVFIGLWLAFRKLYRENSANHLAVWASGIAFGLLHVGNALVGVPIAFVAVQVLNAVIWGVVYGYARAKTESIYPPILLHAAMNLVVVLF